MRTIISKSNHEDRNINSAFLAELWGIIQNYALQQVLMKLGHEPLTLNMILVIAVHDGFTYSKAYTEDSIFRNLPVYPIYKGRIGNKNFIKFVLKISSRFQSKTLLLR